MMKAKQYNAHCTTKKIQNMKKVINTAALLFLILYVAEFFLVKKYPNGVHKFGFDYRFHSLSFKDEGTVDKEENLSSSPSVTEAIPSSVSLQGLDEQVTSESTQNELSSNTPNEIIGWLTSFNGWEETVVAKDSIIRSSGSLPNAVKDAQAQKIKNEKNIERIQHFLDWLHVNKCDDAYIIAQNIIQNESVSKLTPAEEKRLKECIAKYQSN